MSEEAMKVYFLKDSGKSEGKLEEGEWYGSFTKGTIDAAGYELVTKMDGVPVLRSTDVELRKILNPDK